MAQGGILQIAELPHFDPEGVPRFEVIYRFVKHGDAGWFEATGALPRVLDKMAIYDSVVATELFDPELTRTPVVRRLPLSDEESYVRAVGS